MVDEGTVKPPGRLLAEAVSKYSRSYNLKRNSAADPLQEQRGRHVSDNQKSQDPSGGRTIRTRLVAAGARPGLRPRRHGRRRKS